MNSFLREKFAFVHLSVLLLSSYLVVVSPSALALTSSEAIPPPPYLDQKTQVDQMIVFALDVSNSVDKREFDLQREGLIAALRDPEVLNDLQHCAHKGVAIAVMEWSSIGGELRRSMSQKVVLDWTLINSTQSAVAATESLRAQNRSSAEYTDIWHSLEFAEALFKASKFTSVNKLIAMSSDGTQNVYLNYSDLASTFGQLRRRFESEQIEVDTLVIENIDESARARGAGYKDLNDYFLNLVVTGARASSTPVTNYDDYGRQIKSRILKLICPLTS